MFGNYMHKVKLDDKLGSEQTKAQTGYDIEGTPTFRGQEGERAVKRTEKGHP